MLFKSKRRRLLEDIIKLAESFGLAKQDIVYAQEFLEYNEPQLCLDQICTQLYEFAIPVDSRFVYMVEQACPLVGLPPDNFKELKALVKNEESKD